ncbi:MAG TPA: glycosyltransferase [Kouleothrix sp.]|jgi:rhamnosyl/mannosyltransferase|nr:glycosyltransferase [Kouleothrix sp.]
MHILHIYKDYPPVLGGIENHLRDLSAGLAARGHQVTVLVTSRDRQTRIEHPAERLTIIKAARALHLASTPLSPAMLRLARSQRPDVAHLHFPYPPGDLAALALPHRPPLVVTYHSDIVRQQTLLRLYRPLLEYTLSRAARILPTSPNYLASSPFLRRHAARCSVVPLGIDTARFASADPRKVAAIRARYPGPRMLFVGRLRYYKGLHHLLDAMPAIQGELLIGGTGPERAPLEAQARRLGVGQRVHFLGDVPDDDLPALLHAADVFVMPAHLRAEALGLAQIEALASALPCVSTELGTGTSFANLHGVTGLVVPPADPAALAAALNTLLADPELRKRYGAAGRQRTNTLFSQAHMLDLVEQVYNEVASQ